MKAFLMVVGALTLLGAAGAAAMMFLRNRRVYDDDMYQPEIPRPFGVGDSAEGQQVDPYYGGEQLGKTEAEAHYAAP